MTTRIIQGKKNLLIIELNLKKKLNILQKSMQTLISRILKNIQMDGILLINEKNEIYNDELK